MKQMYPKNGRVILHVDMNSFYASVEMSFDPSLKGKPLAIAGNPEERKGIIITSSYEARSKGVKTTMPLWEAKKLCPDLIIRKPHFPRYRQASLAMFHLLSEYTQLIQPVSIDEGYLDITDSANLGTPLDIARNIQNRLKRELDLPCSIGIAPNKFLAKMASDMKKPMGITVLRKRDVKQVLWPLPADHMHGIGKKTAAKLNSIHIRTIGDLAKADVLYVKQLLGINGERLRNYANGEDTSKVDPDAISDYKSIGNSTTLKQDSTEFHLLQNVLQQLSNSVSERMKRQGMQSWNIQITLRYSNRKTVARSRKLIQPIVKEEEVFRAALSLFELHWNEEPIRLLGVTALDLEEKDEINRQLDLFTFEKDAKEEPLLQAMNMLNNKFGNNVVKRGLSIPKNNKYDGTDNDENGTSFQKDFLRGQKWNGE